jgi:hypothetical protein
MAYLSTSVFSLAVGLTFFYNPWLDTKMALQTRANEQMRPVLVALYLLFSLWVGAVYARWIKEENKTRNVAGTAAANLAGTAAANVADTAADNVTGAPNVEKSSQ